MTLFISIAVAWLVCAVISASAYLAYFQGEYPTLAKESYGDDLRRGWVHGLLFGPCGLLAAVICSDSFKHGFMNPFVLNKYKEKT